MKGKKWTKKKSDFQFRLAISDTIQIYASRRGVQIIKTWLIICIITRHCNIRSTRYALSVYLYNFKFLTINSFQGKHNGTNNCQLGVATTNSVTHLNFLETYHTSKFVNKLLAIVWVKAIASNLLKNILL